MLNALLVQLFGRDVIDRLSVAGFDSAEAIASAGPERLSEEGGISLALARRIIAVAMEEPAGPEPESEAVAAGGPEPQPGRQPEPRQEHQPEPHDRHVRRPFRRPHSALASPAPSDSSSDPKRARSGQAARKKEPDQEAGDADPFVDDVGLITWMGTAARHGSASPSSLVVADEILDPGMPRVPAAAEQPAGTPQRPAPEPTAASEPTAVRPATANEPTAARPRLPARERTASPVLVERSFWSFGIPLERKAATAPRTGEPEETSPRTIAPGEGAASRGTVPPPPRRRSNDGH